MKLAFLLAGSSAFRFWFVPDAFSQADIDPRKSVSALMDQLTREPFMRVTANLLADAGAVEAIPLLESRFAGIQVPSTPAVLTSEAVIDKAIIAGALVRLGSKKSAYWDFLATEAERAVEDQTPFPIKLDSKGDLVPKELSPEFRLWAQSKNVFPEEAAWDKVYRLPGPLLALAMTGDPRGLPILRKGLLSPNFLVQVNAARGLAFLGDNDSIKPIIDACAKSGPTIAMAIAQWLVFFDGPEAEAASERFVQNRELIEGLRQRKAQFRRSGLFR